MSDKKTSQITSTITWIAGTVALIVAVCLPLGYFALSYQYQVGEIGTESQFNAKLVSEFIQENPESWRFQESRLIDFLLEEDRIRAEYPEQRRILGADGEEIAISDAFFVSAPVISIREPVMYRGKVVAYFEVNRSLRPLLVTTALVALFGFVLASALFAALKIVPLRALNRALASLRQSEHLFSQAFHASPDPGMICRAEDGRIINVNKSFAQLSGYTLPEVVGRTHGDVALWADEDVIARAMQQLRLGQPVHNLEMTLLTKSGEHRDMLVSSEITEVGDALCSLTVARDVTEQKRAEQRMVYLANYDHLTGLPNRALFRDRLAGAMQRAQRAEHLVGLLYLDLDRFKQVNDSLGHQVGDQLLKQVAERLRQCVRLSDTIALSAAREELFGCTVARLGGDEFTLVLEDIKHIDEITRIAQRIVSALAIPFDLNGHQAFVGASIGITVFPFDDDDLDNLIRNADVAMYRAKALGRNNFQFYTDDLNANAEERLLLEAELRQALELNQFELVYQPKLNLRTNLISGVEALLRWRSPRKGLVPPTEFITLLEETGLIVPVGAWVLRTACEQAVDWARGGMRLSMAVNLSARQFCDESLIAIIRSAMNDAGLPADQLELEVTESLLMEDSVSSQTALANIKKMGVKISMDDFGTGYSSLAYLKRFPLDTLKIDRSFVKDVGVDPDDTAIVRAVIALSHNLRLTVVAEGVETREQLKFLREARCDQAQGYFISRPMGAAAFEVWMAENYDGQIAGTTPVHSVNQA
ncbi:MAG: EAL domain-containing protein [Thiobacillus sp.]|nr:EAL domain-containing protein [Thiobacillus sp.]